MTSLNYLYGLNRNEIIELAYKWELTKECLSAIPKSHKKTIAFWIHLKMQHAAKKAILTINK